MSLWFAAHIQGGTGHIQKVKWVECWWNHQQPNMKPFLMAVARIVTGETVVHGLDLRVGAGSWAAAGAVSLLDDFAAGINATDNSAHGGGQVFGRDR